MEDKETKGKTKRTKGIQRNTWRIKGKTREPRGIQGERREWKTKGEYEEKKGNKRRIRRI